MSSGVSHYHATYLRLRDSIRDISDTLKGRRMARNSSHAKDYKKNLKSIFDNVQEIIKLNTDPVEPTQDSEIVLGNTASVEPTQDSEIVKILGKSYNTEDEFDKALFQALSEDLKAFNICVEKVYDEENVLKYIVLEQFNWNQYYFGFARQARRLDVVPRQSEKDHKQSSNHVNDTEGRNPQCDHSCCLFEKSENKGLNRTWKARGVFSVVELKMSDKSSMEGKGHNRLLIDGDTMIQPISYGLESVWPSLCRFDLGKNEESIIIALVAAKRENKDTSANRHRWVKGYLRVPKEWGDYFKLCKSGSQCFPNADDNDDDDGPKNAADLYTETMLEGLKLGRKLIKQCKDEKVNSPFDLYPTQLSGPLPQKLKNGELVASPLLSRETVEKLTPEGKFYHITQGELYFFKELNLKDLGDEAKGETKWLISGDKVENVLVKVWYQGVHNYLQEPPMYIQAISHLKSKLDTNKQDEKKKMEKLKKSLTKVFLGIRFKLQPKVTFTVMCKVTGVPVKLKENKQSMNDYWGYFKKLCDDILLPLADMGIIYRDLRPGYDCTYNVLLVDNNGKKEMVLVDYESLCLAISYSPIDDKRYPQDFLDDDGPSKAHDFLFQQCVAIAYSWIKEKKSEELNFNDALVWWYEAKEELSQNDGESDADEDDKVERALKEWEIMLSKEDNKDEEKTKKVFDDLFTQLGKLFKKKVHGGNTEQNTPVATSHTAPAVTADANDALGRNNNVNETDTLGTITNANDGKKRKHTSNS